MHIVSTALHNMGLIQDAKKTTIKRDVKKENH